MQAIENDDEEDSEEDDVPEITYCEAMVWLAVITLWISVLSGYLVDTIQVHKYIRNVLIILLPFQRESSLLFLFFLFHYNITIY